MRKRVPEELSLAERPSLVKQSPDCFTIHFPQSALAYANAESFAHCDDATRLCVAKAWL